MAIYKFFDGDWKEGSDVGWLEHFLFDEIETKRPSYSVKNLHEAVVTPCTDKKVRLDCNRRIKEILSIKYYLYIEFSTTGEEWDDNLEIDVDKNTFERVTQIVEEGDNAYFEYVESVGGAV